MSLRVLGICLCMEGKSTDMARSVDAVPRVWNFFPKACFGIVCRGAVLILLFPMGSAKAS